MTLLQDYDRFRKEHRPHAMTHKNCRWEYLLGGEGKQAIVVLHGGGTTSDAAWEYISAFEKNYRVLAPTLPTGIRSMQDTVDGIAEILRKENIAKAHLLGFSQGGMIAQCFARAHSDMTVDMILFVTMGPSPAYAPRFRRRLHILTLMPDFLIRTMSKRFISKQILAEKGPRETLEYWAAFFVAVIDAGRMNKAGLIASGRVLLDYFCNYTFHPDDLKDHGGRILILEAEKDAIVNPVERERLKRLYPQAEVISIKNSGHFGFGLLEAKPLIKRMHAFLTKK